MARYANAPLRYVAFAADISPASVLGETPALDRIHAALREDLPVREDVTEAVIQVVGGLGRTSGARFVDSSRHRAVLVTPPRIAVDTTSYSTFREFSSFLERVLDAVADVAPGRACNRLGLRYVDEIRVPGMQPASVAQWRDWIDPSLFPEVALSEAAGRREMSGAIEETRENGFGVRFAWHTGTGHLVAPQGPLLVPDPSEPGPYFALDTDSYWIASPGVPIVGLGDPTLPARIRQLHDPVQAFFESSLTERLRAEILKPLESQ